MLTVKKICGDKDGMMVTVSRKMAKILTVSRKMAKILTVSRKMAKILTVSRKSYHLLRPSFPEKASAPPPLPHPPLPPHFPYSSVQFSFLITATAYSKDVKKIATQNDNKNIGLTHNHTSLPFPCMKFRRKSGPIRFSCSSL